MNSITQDMRFRLSVVLSDYRVGATKTAIRYKVTRQFVFLGSIGITMMISVPSPIAPIVLPITQTNIPIWRSNGSRTFVAGIPIWASSISGCA